MEQMPAEVESAIRTVGAPSVDALEALYEEHYRGLLRAAYLILGSREEAEEVVQDAFTRLAGSLWRLRRVEKAGGYLYAAVVNGCRSRVRRRGVAKRHSPVFDVDLTGVERDRMPQPGPDYLTERAEISSALRIALDQLAPRQRECVVMRYFLGLSEAQTAEAMGVSKGSVKAHHSRAVAALGGLMESYR